MPSGNDAIVLQNCVTFFTEIGNRLWNYACALPSIVAGWSVRTRSRALRGTSDAESLGLPHGLVQTFSLTSVTLDAVIVDIGVLLFVVSNQFSSIKVYSTDSTNSMLLTNYQVNQFHSAKTQQQTQRQQKQPTP